jgi:general secretion pathway protein K
VSLPTRDDAGTAFVTALLAVAVFALLAMEILEIERGTSAVLDAESAQGRLVAAADAGLAQTIYQLGLKDGSQRLQPDGRVHSSYFEGVELAVTAQNERGKIPLNSVGAEVERRLFAAVGVEGERLDMLVDALDDWKDGDDSARRHGAETPYYLPFGYPAHNSEIRTVDELGDIKGMDADTLARIAPAVTVSKGIFGTFSSDLATPLALLATSNRTRAQIDADRRRDALAGNRPVIDFVDNFPPTGRVIAVTVVASLPDRGRFRREVVLQFTGDHNHPVWIRSAR